MKSIDQQTLKKILKLIQKHIGKDDPIKVKDISNKVNLSDREIRRIVQTLVNDEGYAIGSTTKGPYGFFVISDEEDFSAAVKNLTSREKKIGERILKLINNSKSEGVEIKKFNKKIVDKSQTINIKNLFFINIPHADN